jgi:hypothetical protein
MRKLNDTSASLVKFCHVVIGVYLYVPMFL